MKFSPSFHRLLALSSAIPLFFLSDINATKVAKSVQFRNKNDNNGMTGFQSKLIIGGTEAEKGRYPYQVAMVDSTGFQFCGGTLIDPDWVLSAAHCVGIGSTVEIGHHNLEDDSEEHESIPILFEIISPLYNFFSLDNDVMLVRLATSSKFPPVALNDGSVNVTEGLNVTTMGWGVVDVDTGESSDVLMEVEVDIVTNDDCNMAYNDTVTENMICASRADKDSCQGDSGGPLIVKGENATLDVQIGIVSWGRGCAEPGFPSVYTNLASDTVRDFITETLSCTVADDFPSCCETICTDAVATCAREKPQIAPGCVDVVDCWIGDGFCDFFQNTNACNFDGGDCCVGSCEGILCGTPSFQCLDPEHQTILEQACSFIQELVITIEDLTGVDVVAMFEDLTGIDVTFDDDYYYY